MNHHSKWLPPFRVFVCREDGSQETLAEGMNYPDAIQLRLTWQRNLESKGYKKRFTANRMSKESLWQECHILDTNGKAV